MNILHNYKQTTYPKIKNAKKTQFQPESTDFERRKERSRDANMHVFLTRYLIALS